MLGLIFAASSDAKPITAPAIRVRNWRDVRARGVVRLAP
jgi:hypothetical protein